MTRRRAVRRHGHNHTARCQQFTWGGLYAWCVTHAELLLEQTPELAMPQQVSIAGADAQLGLESLPPGAVPVLQYKDLDREYAMTTDLDKPLLMVTVPALGGAAGHGPVVIDGWHRMYRARREGRDTLPGLLLLPRAETITRLYPHD